jgi:hypothetical protein
MKITTLFALALTLGACTETLPLSGAPCPCAAGTYCDVTGDRLCHPLQDSGKPAVTTQDSSVLIIDESGGTPPITAVSDAGYPPSQPDGAGGEDAAEPTPPDEIPTQADAKACSVLGVASARDFERKFIAPRCGSGACHQAIFPPRHLDQPERIREQVVGVRSLVLCKDDFYIDREDPGRSFFLNKCAGTTNVIRCATDGAQDSGGSRMPNAEGAPAGTAGPLLNQYELACLKWWVFTVAKK